MKKKLKQMINSDILECEKMMKKKDNRDFYNMMYSKYKAIDNDLSISIKAKVLGFGYDLDYSYEINQLIGKLKAYLISGKIGNNSDKKVVVKINNKNGILGDNNTQIIDKKINVNADINISKEEKTSLFQKIASIFKKKK